MISLGPWKGQSWNLFAASSTRTKMERLKKTAMFINVPLTTPSADTNLQEIYMEGQAIMEAFKEDKGKKFDTGKPMIGLISAYAIEQEAKVMTFGAEKYGFHNWRAGLSWLRVISAVLRHIFAFLRGEDFDPETGIHHLAHARCGLAFILEYTQTHPEKDDRAK